MADVPPPLPISPAAEARRGAAAWRTRAEAAEARVAELEEALRTLTKEPFKWQIAGQHHAWITREQWEHIQGLLKGDEAK